jgi:hypothetical protein
MKFKVRDGFVISHTVIITQGEKGQEKRSERLIQVYPEDGAVDLDKAVALANAHKLEPADKDAGALLAGMAVPAPDATTIVGGMPAIDVNALAQSIGQAMVQASAQSQAIAAAGQQQSKS